MNRLICAALFSASSLALGGVPQAVVTFTDTYEGYATVAGKLSETPRQPVGVTVENGNLKYSTITDRSGNWSVVFRQRAMSYRTSAFSLQNEREIGKTTSGELDK